MALTLDEFFALPFLEGMERLAALPEQEQVAFHAEIEKRQAAARRSYTVPVHRYRPSVEEGRCLDDFEG